MLLPFLLLTLATAPADSARATDADRAEAPYELEGSTSRDLTVTAASAAAWIATETLFKSRLAPLHCRWCDTRADGSDALNAVDRWGRGLRAGSATGRSRADAASSVLDYAALPLALVGVESLVLTSNRATRHAWEDLLDVGEAVALAGVLNQGVKFAAGRERPFVHELAPAQKGQTSQPSDNNLSFYSGHSTVAFSLVVASGTVAALRGYEGAGWIWAVGLPLACTVPVLRMVADKHYLSDVVVGSLMGAGIGFAVPFFLHPRKRRSPWTNVHVGVGPGGLSLAWVTP